MIFIFNSMFSIIVLVAVITIVAQNVVIVPQGKCYVVEMLGKYKETWQAGLHFKIPFVMRVVRRISIKEQVADFPPQPVITKDNVTMQIDTVVYYKVFDAQLYTYGVENPITALENLTATTLRNIIGDLELDQTLTSRDTVNTKMKDIIDEATDAWGLKVSRVELKNIIPPQEIRVAMEKQMKAEREKRQTILEAEAHKEAAVRRAQGDKEAVVIKAQAEKEARIAKATGEAEAIRLVYEAEARGLKMLKEANMDDKVMLLKKLDTLKAVGDGQATKIILPTELTETASKLTVASEMLGFSDMIVDQKERTQDHAAVTDVCCNDATKSSVTKELVEEDKTAK